MVRITVVKVFDRLPGVAGQVRAGARLAVTKTVADLEAQAKSRAPVDTGALRNSITGTMTGETEGEVSTNQEYAPHQEWGTRFQPGTPFMRPAADAVRPGFEAAMKAVLGDLG
jgi:HK97 gp10 family phage protein